MYDKSRKEREVIVLRGYSNALEQVSEIIKKTPDVNNEITEERIWKLGNFLSSISFAIKENTKIVQLCREHCSLDMTTQCFSLEIIEEKRRMQQNKNDFKNEIMALIKILEEVDGVIKTSKFNNETRRSLMHKVKCKHFVKFKQEYDVILETAKMICSTEITLKKAKAIFAELSLHLNSLKEDLN